MSRVRVGTWGLVYWWCLMKAEQAWGAERVLMCLCQCRISQLIVIRSAFTLHWHAACTSRMCFLSPSFFSFSFSLFLCLTHINTHTCTQAALGWANCHISSIQNVSLERDRLRKERKCVGITQTDTNWYKYVYFCISWLAWIGLLTMIWFLHCQTLCLWG